MNSNSSIQIPSSIKKLLASNTLPGKEAHLKMAPPARIDTLLSEMDASVNAKKAAVLIALYFKNEELYTVFIKRNVYDGVHSGQIAFPGGKMEETDSDLIYTAIRETEEEIGIKKEDINVLGILSPLYIPPSNYLIEPVVGFVNTYPHFKLQEEEVQGVIEIPIQFFHSQPRIQLFIR